MRSTKPVPLMLVIGAVALGALSDRLGGATSITASIPSIQPSKGRTATAEEAGTRGASGVHISPATVEQINELLRLYGIPVVLSTSASGAVPPRHGVTACFESERETLIVSLSVGG